jgi:multicomponent Na+:H+ antiporter subunit E
MARGTGVDHTHTKPRAIDTLKWAIFYVGLWALLSQNQGWEFGILFVALALLCSYKTHLRAPALVWRHFPRFLLFFLQRLFVGGVDVALSAVSPKLAISPAWVDYELQGNSPDVSLALSVIVGLLPGTLAAKIDGQSMRVHLLDARADWQRDIGKLEAHLALLLGVREQEA